MSENTKEKKDNDLPVFFQKDLFPLAVAYRGTHTRNFSSNEKLLGSG
jgi:hypothetical protein